jgi:hypothetical protein
MSARRPVNCICPPEREGIWCESARCRNNPALSPVAAATTTIPNDPPADPVGDIRRLAEVLGDRPIYPLDPNDQT